MKSPGILALALLAALRSSGQPLQYSIQNDQVIVKFMSPSGFFSLSSKATGKVFFRDATFESPAGSVRTLPVTDKIFGRGESLEISQADGRVHSLSLFPGLPFVLCRSVLHNGGTEPNLTRSVKMISGTVELGLPADRLRTFGTGGLLEPDKNPGSYAWLAIADPASRQGMVVGWLTEDSGSGVVFSPVKDNQVKVEARLDFGRLRIPAGKSRPLETLAIGYFDDARLGLEAWADAVAKSYAIHLPPQPAGYCTWYSKPYGGAADEQHLAELAAFAKTNLAPFGFSVVQIDDHWQPGVSTNGPKRNFTTHNPSGPYPGGMKATAANIHSLGLTPGLWFMPFAGTWYDPFFKDHSDWFVKREDGTPYETAWGGTCLDMTHPGARQHLKALTQRIAHEWGFTYFKLDGLWTGTGTRQQYVNSGYKEDNMGDAVFHNPDKSNLEAFRDGLRLVRETAGPGVFVLGCNGPQNMRSYGGAFGLVDAMRIGPDNNSNWKGLLRGPTFGTRHYFLHGRVWYNDPDPVYVRADMPLNHAQLICSWVALSGQLNLSSEWLPGLPADRLDLLKRTMPAHGAMARPADLFERDLPGLWLVTDRRATRRDVIGVFNWETNEQTFDCSIEHLGLDPAAEYAAFDYWHNTMSAPVTNRLRLTLPAESCAVLAVRPRANHPQLLSTSRHITQGMVDVVDESWDPKGRILKGRSRVVGGDPYELRILADLPAGGITVSTAKGAPAVTATLKTDGPLIRATILSPASGEIGWSVQFKR